MCFCMCDYAKFNIIPKQYIKQVINLKFDHKKD